MTPIQLTILLVLLNLEISKRWKAERPARETVIFGFSQPRTYCEARALTTPLSATVLRLLVNL